MASMKCRPRARPDSVSLEQMTNRSCDVTSTDDVVGFTTLNSAQVSFNINANGRMRGGLIQAGMQHVWSQVTLG
jgi:hypothetical protein